MAREAGDLDITSPKETGKGERPIQEGAGSRTNCMPNMDPGKFAIAGKHGDATDATECSGPARTRLNVRSIDCYRR